MKNISNNFLGWVKNHKVWSVVIILIIIGVAWYFIFGGKKPSENIFVLAERGDVRQEVSVTGNVKPLTDVSLAFERGGRVASLNVAVGDRVYVGQYLASVSNADLLANLDQAKANLKKVKAVLGDAADKTTLDFTQAQNSLLNAIKDSYTKADDAVRNKIFSLFTDPARYRAKLSFTADNFLQEDIEEDKDTVVDVLDAWYRKLNRTDISADLEGNYTLARTNLFLIKSLLDKCAEAVNILSVESSGSTQTQIDTWKLNISTARTNINTAVDSLTNSYNIYKSSDLSVAVSKNNTLAEEAGVEQAEASLASAEAELAKTIILSPISGVITNLDVKLGEIVSVGKNVISVISYGNYEVEAFVPEADIAKVKIGDKARTTLDAYGDSIIFETVVSQIDPAATLIDGVPTYKVTLIFTNQDDRVKSGMTANLDILTAEKKDILTVPIRAVYSKDGNRYVKILNIDGSIVEEQIEVGLRGSDGKMEIVSGLNEGDKVLTNI